MAGDLCSSPPVPSHEILPSVLGPFCPSVALPPSLSLCPSYDLSINGNAALSKLQSLEGKNGKCKSGHHPSCSKRKLLFPQRWWL